MEEVGFEWRVQGTVSCSRKERRGELAGGRLGCMFGNAGQTGLGRTQDAKSELRPGVMWPDPRRERNSCPTFRLIILYCFALPYHTSRHAGGKMQHELKRVFE